MYCFNWSTTYWAKERCHFESRSTKGSHWECNSPTVCRSKVHQIKVAIICWIMWYSKGSSLCSSASTSELVPKWRVPQCNKMTTVKKDIVLLKHQTKILTDVMGCSTKKKHPAGVHRISSVEVCTTNMATLDIQVSKIQTKIHPRVKYKSRIVNTFASFTARVAPPAELNHDLPVEPWLLRWTMCLFGGHALRCNTHGSIWDPISRSLGLVQTCIRKTHVEHGGARNSRPPLLMLRTLPFEHVWTKSTQITLSDLREWLQPIVWGSR